MTKHGHLDASADPAVIAKMNWRHANGYGVPMGGGLYALDADTYKPECQAGDWLRAHGVPTETRIHLTVRGGHHLIYRLPPAYAELRNVGNIAPGLELEVGRGVYYWR